MNINTKNFTIRQIYWLSPREVYTKKYDEIGIIETLIVFVDKDKRKLGFYKIVENSKTVYRGESLSVNRNDIDSFIDCFEYKWSF